MTGVVLALDSSTGSVSVAVASAGAAVPGAAVTGDDPAGGDGAVLAVRTTDSGNHHVELLVPLAREVLAQAGVAVADVRAVAVGVGPGPFTGTRVGVVTALTLGAALGVPVTGVCSLDVLALGAVRSGAVGPGVGGTATEFLAVTDARRREVYWARYELVRDGGVAEGVRRVDGPSVGHPAAVPRAGELPSVGAGAVLYPDVFSRVLPDGPHTPDAAVLAGAVTGSLLPPFPPEPLYLRRPDARRAPPPIAAPGIAR